MKNIMSSLIVVFSLFITQLAHAIPADCESGEVKLSDLKYVGADLKPLLRKNGACTVVAASTDNQGQAACGEKRAALNPGNPQYTGTNKYGSQMSNNLHYYFCVGMNKRQMCNDRISELSSSMDIEWKQTGSGRNDGDCLCRKKGDTSAKMMACPVTEAQVDAMKEGNSTGCVKGASKEGNRCMCDLNKEIEAKKEGDCPTEAPKQVTAEVDDNDFDECLADIKAAKEACSDKGQAAISKCNKDAPANNKNISEAQRVMSIGLDALVAKNAGTGALEACAQMSAAGTAVIEGLGFFKENCKKELESCKKGCEDLKAFSGDKAAEDMAKACKAKFEQKNPPKAWDDAHQKRFAELTKTYQDASANAEKFCKGDAQIADNNLGAMMDDLASRVQAADICKCQLTSASTGSGGKGDKCESVMTPLTCMQNLNQPGCSFSSVGCSPGSTIAGCRNPVQTTNTNGSGVAMPASGFAGPGFGSGGSGGGAGKVNVGDGDFNGLFDETRPTGSATATADNGAPFGAAGSAGGSGGSGNFGGGGDGAGGKDGDGGEKSGLSGFFNNAKGAVMSMLGGGGDKGGTSKKPNSKSFKDDVNGYRPKGAVRGMANAGEVGGKNRDIWKTMNERYTDQYHTFITVETPSK